MLCKLFSVEKMLKYGLLKRSRTRTRIRWENVVQIIRCGYAETFSYAN